MSALTIRLPRTLHEQLKRAAKAEGVSLNQLVVVTLAQHVARYDVEQSLRDQARWFAERTHQGRGAEGVRRFFEAYGRDAEPPPEDALR